MTSRRQRIVIESGRRYVEEYVGSGVHPVVGRWTHWDVISDEPAPIVERTEAPASWEPKRPKPKREAPKREDSQLSTSEIFRQRERRQKWRAKQEANRAGRVSDDD